MKFGAECTQEVVKARKYVAKRKECPYCGKEMAATNVFRHINEACQGRWGKPPSEANAFQVKSLVGDCNFEPF